MAVWPEAEWGGETAVDCCKRKKESRFSATEIESPETAEQYANGLIVGGTDALVDQKVE